jgi:hypothetical protein
MIVTYSERKQKQNATQDNLKEKEVTDILHSNKTNSSNESNNILCITVDENTSINV